MSTLVADASPLVSLGIAVEDTPEPLALCLAHYEVVVPTAVIAEIREVASYDDRHGRAGATVLNRTDSRGGQPRAAVFDITIRGVLGADEDEHIDRDGSSHPL